MSSHPPENKDSPLLRILGLPLLILYGVGVTVGAGIFVMIGTVVGHAGPRSALAFVIAAAIAGLTAVSYATLSAGFPQAAGASLYVKTAVGRGAGLITGIGVAATGIVSSATIVLGFTGYVSELIALPPATVVLAALVAIALIVQRGVKESVAAAAVVTVIELGILLILIGVGLPEIARLEVWNEAFGAAGSVPTAAIVTAAVIAFFAFIGFESIVNMAEETVNPARTMGKAIFGTLAITTAIYVLLALVAANAPDVGAVARSPAPLATLWTQLTGTSSRWLSAMATIAVINGVIVQVIMVSRLLYGMAREGMMPAPLAKVGSRHTPYVATWCATCLIALLALTFHIEGLARATATVTLLVFASANLSLVVIGTRQGGGPLYRRRWVGVLGTAVTGGLALRELAVIVGAN